jgi:hypothetical protein
MKLSYLGTPSLCTRKLKGGGVVWLRRYYCPMFLPPRRAPSSFTTFVIKCTLMLYPQPQTHGTGEYLPFQGATEDQGTRAMDGNVRPVCVYCSKDFGRIQELKRHVKDKHMPGADARGAIFCGLVQIRSSFTSSPTMRRDSRQKCWKASRRYSADALSSS